MIFSLQLSSQEVLRVAMLVKCGDAAGPRLTSRVDISKSGMIDRDNEGPDSNVHSSQKHRG